MPANPPATKRVRNQSAESQRNERANGRRERKALHYKFSLYTPPENIADPVLHLEKQRANYISRLEQMMDDPLVDSKLVAQIAVQLLKFGSLGKIKTDIGEALQKLMKEPDLARVSPAMLDRIISGETVDVPELEDMRALDANDTSASSASTTPDDDEP